MARSLPLTTALLAVLVFASGCYRPGGALMPYTGAPQTYYSTETRPKTVRIVDVRTNDVVFSMDIPVGKQLTMDFEDGAGDDPVYTPDTLRYEVFDLGTKTGKLRSQMSVPNANCRRVDITLRPAPEYAKGDPERPLRTDELADRPDWWTPKGGKLPDDLDGLTIYDD